MVCLLVGRPNNILRLVAMCLIQLQHNQLVTTLFGVQELILQRRNRGASDIQPYTYTRVSSWFMRMTCYYIIHTTRILQCTQPIHQALQLNLLNII